MPTRLDDVWPLGRHGFKKSDLRDPVGMAIGDCLTDQERLWIVREAGVSHRDSLCMAALQEAEEKLSRRRHRRA